MALVQAHERLELARVLEQEARRPERELARVLQLQAPHVDMQQVLATQLLDARNVVDLLHRAETLELPFDRTDGPQHSPRDRVDIRQSIERRASLLVVLGGVDRRANRRRWHHGIGGGGRRLFVGTTLLAIILVAFWLYSRRRSARRCRRECLSSPTAIAIRSVSSIQRSSHPVIRAHLD